MAGFPDVSECFAISDMIRHGDMVQRMLFQLIMFLQWFDAEKRLWF
jgi:hypothetical protein